MILVYDHNNVLHLTNERGLRWNYDRADKPQFSFDYDFLFYIPQDNVLEIELNEEKISLSDENISEIEEYIKLCDPPTSISLAKQFIEEIRIDVTNRVDHVRNKIHEVTNFKSRADIMIAGREGSNDPRRQIARRYMEWVDFAHGISERLQEELRKTLDEDLREVEHYLDQMPACPPLEHFVDGQYIDERFNTETLDVEGGQDDLGEDKRAV